MSGNAFNRIMRGLKEVEGYRDGERAPEMGFAKKLPVAALARVYFDALPYLPEIPEPVSFQVWRSPMSKLRFLSLSSILATLLLSFSVFPAFAQRAVSTRQVPALVTSGKAPVLGALNQNETMHLVINLALRNENQLDALIADLYNPASKHFRKYLTPGEFDARFGPDQASFNEVVSWAESNGFTIVSKASNNRLVEVTAPVSAVDKAFHVSIMTYRDNRLDRTFHAPDREPTVDLDVPLASIEGLDNADPIHNNLVAGPHAKSTTSSGTVPVAGPKTTSTAATPHIVGSAPDGEYLPSDMRAAYYGSGPITGAGQSVGIFSFDGYLASDLNVYYAHSGFSSSIPVTNRLAGGYSGGCFSSTNGTSGTCDDGEQILDIVQVQGMAPGLSQIYFYEGSTASTELNLMATDNLVKVITSSWGGGGFGTASDTYFKQMATQGQSFLNATGDDGAFNSTTYSSPSLDPYIIQVGGTSLVTSGAGGPWSSETAWPYSGGGFWITGISTSGKYTIPTWQSSSGVITTANQGSTTYRNVPDMAAEGDFDNPTVSNGAYMTGYGGTSFAAPRMAGYMALVNQFALANGGNVIGFFDPTLYSGDLTSSYSHYMHDITVGSNPATGGTAVSYPAVAGYDDVTGWGSPNGEGLLYYLAAVPDFSVAAGSQSLTITRGATGNTGNQMVSVTPYNGFSGSVTVTTSALPTGVTYTATTGTSSSPATVTFTANGATAIQGTYPITLTGTSGTLSRTSSFTLNILKRQNGDFTLSASSPSILEGTSGASVVTIGEGALSGPIALTVSGLPSGVTAGFANPSYDNAGTISSTVTGTDNLTLNVPYSVFNGTYPVTVTGTSAGNLVHSTTFMLMVTAPPSPVLDGGFETVSGGVAANWTLTSGVLTANVAGAHSGTYFAYLDGYGSAHTDTATQTSIAIPSGKTSATLAFYLYIGTAETTTTAKNDTFTIALTPSGGSATTVATFSNLDAGSGYVYHAVDVSAFIGQTVTLTFTGVENASLETSFKLDDVSLYTK